MEFRSRPELDAQRLRVEAIGEPGQRRFRLLAIVGGETTIIWMEKQQLQALGLALEQLLAQLPDGAPDLSPTSAPIEFDSTTRRQFRAGRMELGYDERQDRIVVVAHDLNEDDEEESLPIGGNDDDDFACRITREQAREISADAAAVVSAGRPRCTMCGSPMGPGPHVCPQQNGHLPQALGETEPDSEEI